MKKLLIILSAALLLMTSLAAGAVVSSGKSVGTAERELLCGWEYGSLDPTSGAQTEDGSEDFVRSGFVCVADYDEITVQPKDDNIKYNILYYNSNKKLLSAASSETKPSLSGKTSAKVNSVFARLVCAGKKKLELSGKNFTEPMILSGKNRVFCLTEIEKGKKNPFYCWQIGRLDPISGGEVSDYSGAYFRTDFIPREGFNSVKATVLDNTCRYNIFYYDENKAFIGCLQSKTGSTINKTASYLTPESAKYLRLFVCRYVDGTGLTLSQLEQGDKLCFTGENSQPLTTTAEDLWSAGGISPSTGTSEKTASKNVFSSDYLGAESFNVFYACVPDMNASYSVFYYDKNKYFIPVEKYNSPQNTNLSGKTLFPDDVKYLRFSVSLPSGTDKKSLSDGRIRFELGFDGDFKAELNTQGAFKTANIFTQNGLETADASGNYYASNYVDCGNMKRLKVNVNDQTYMYNVFWYRADKSFISALSPYIPPKNNTESAELDVPQGAGYLRLLVCRSQYYGGVEPYVLNGKSRISFEYFDKNNTLRPLEEELKAENTLAVSASEVEVKLNDLKKADQRLYQPVIRNPVGALTTSVLKDGTSKELTGKLDFTSGVLTLKRCSLKKGAYTAILSVTAEGDSLYRSKTERVTLTIRIV